MEVIDKVTVEAGEWTGQDSQYFQSEGPPPLTNSQSSPVLSDCDANLVNDLGEVW